MNPLITKGMTAQLATRRARIAAGEKPLGWKVGLGAPATMQKLGLDAPVVGFLMQRALVLSGGTVSLSGYTKPVAEAALDWLGIDSAGFDEMDRKILLTILDKFDGGPVGIESLAAAVQEDKGTLEDVYEPYLIQAAMLERTGRGRQATRLAYAHFKKQKDLFSQSGEAEPSASH